MTGIERIKRMLASTRRRLYWLAILKAFGLAMALTGIWFGLALAGVLDRLPIRIDAWLSLVSAIGLFALWIRGILRFRAPTRNEARLLVDSLSETRPASARIDHSARHSFPSTTLWQAHMAKLDAELATLPTPRLLKKANAIDPTQLRIAIPVLLATLLVFAGGDAPSRILNAFSADFGYFVGADKIKVQAWITPPSYTGRAPFELQSTPDGLSLADVPVGSELTIRLASHSQPKIKIRRNDAIDVFSMDQGVDGIYESQLSLDTEPHMLAEVDVWGTRASFELALSGDASPEISFKEEPVRGKQDTLDFKWDASDDFGIQSVTLILSLAKPKPDETHIEDRILLDLPGIEPKSASSSTSLNLTRHKWAGLDVRLLLEAIDAAGQSGFSDVKEFALPEKLFLQPVAQAAMEVRQTVLREEDTYKPIENAQIQDVDISRASYLESAPDDVRKAAIMLDALTYRADTYFNDPILFMGLRKAREILTSSRDKDEANKSEGLLWAVAMRAEYGTLASAAQALEAARNALEKALRDGASEDEIKRLMQAYRQAVENYLEMRMAEALRRGIDPSELDGPQMDRQNVGGSDLERMMQALEELAETGAHDQARQLLSDMSAMLENLKDFKFTQGSNGDVENQFDSPMSKALEKLAEALRKQRELNDDTDQAARDQNAPNQGQSSLPAPGQNESEGNEGSSSERRGSSNADANQGLSDRQQALIDELKGLNGMGGGSETGDRQSDESGSAAGLGRAQRALEKALDAIENGDLETAQKLQQYATREMGDAATKMAERADAERSKSLGDRPKSSERQANDPLGRPTSNGALGDGGDVEVPEEMNRQKARTILEELRRRSEERDLTEEELDYLKRLLDRF